MVKHKKETREHATVELIREINDTLAESDVVVQRACPGYRNDNNWFLYDPNYINTISVSEADCKTWEQSKFVDKSYWGYYCWPHKLHVNANKRNTFTYSDIGSLTADTTPDFAEAVKPIKEKFQYDSDFVRKFIKLALVESTSSGSGNAKETEKFDKKRFYLFKALFRNFGTLNIFNGLFDHLAQLIVAKSSDSSMRECSHKLAGELLSGLIRGSKYWNLNILKYMWSKLKPLLDLIMDNLTNETVSIWIDCFSHSFVSPSNSQYSRWHTMIV
jgi:hypothetical protein